jgi:septum formation inhibitor-activating ATPase MinD
VTAVIPGPAAGQNPESRDLRQGGLDSVLVKRSEFSGLRCSDRLLTILEHDGRCGSNGGKSRSPLVLRRERLWRIWETRD